MRFAYPAYPTLGVLMEPPKSFNPCCIGLGIQTRHSREGGNPGAEALQSLSYWIGYSDPTHH